MGFKYYVARYTNWFLTVGTWIMLALALLVLVGRNV